MDEKGLELTRSGEMVGRTGYEVAAEWRDRCKAAEARARELEASLEAERRLGDSNAAELLRRAARLEEALAWAVGFIRCNLPKTSADYPDMRNAEDLVSGAGVSGEFHRTCCRAEVAEDRARELEAEVARLREGLRPFADAGIPDNWPAECVLTWDAHDEPHDTAFVNYLPLRVGGGPTVGDYRRAAALLGDSQ